MVFFSIIYAMDSTSSTSDEVQLEPSLIFKGKWTQPPATSTETADSGHSATQGFTVRWVNNHLILNNTQEIVEHLSCNV